MPRLAHGFVSELKSKIDLFDVISPYVQLKKSGTSWVGLSPFTKEKTPSFYVHPDKGFFKCFSSGEGGDAISFIQKIENLEFQEALEFLAQRFNVRIRFEDNLSNRESSSFSRSLRSQLHDLHRYSAEWFHQQFLRSGEEFEKTRNYWLIDRGFNLETAEEFQIGYAPIDRFLLGKFISSKGFPDAVLSKSGLFHQGKNSKPAGCLFNGRLMIPIHDKIGRICAFTARKLDHTPEWGDRKSPKYVNSPETPIFEKGNLLFNLHLANKHVSENNEFLLVEGQLDAIRCWTEGFKTAVAPQGTAFKDSQATLLFRARPKGVVCLLDGDSAGQKAALSYISIFLKTGLDARFAELPLNSDPDKILQQNGADTLKNLIDNALPMLEFVVSKKLANPSSSSPKEKESLCNWIFSALSEIDSKVALEGYFQQLSQLISIPVDALKSDFSKLLKSKSPRYRTTEKQNEQKIATNQSDRLTIVEEDLLFLLLHDDRIASPLANTLDMSWVDLHPVAGRILAKILSEIRAEGGKLTKDQIQELLEDDEERALFHKLCIQTLQESETEARLRLASQCLSVLFLRDLKNQEEQIFEQLKNSDTDSTTLSKLSEKLREIRQKRANPPLLQLNT